MEILEQLKTIIENEVLNESSKDFYLREISELKKEKQQEIINLVERMEQAGFKNNFASAFSEVTENIPQFARMTVFKELHKISRNVEVNCDYACDLDESGDWDNLIEKFKKCFFERRCREVFAYLHKRCYCTNLRLFRRRQSSCSRR